MDADSPMPRSATRPLSEMDSRVGCFPVFMYWENLTSYFEQAKNFRRRVRERDGRYVVTGSVGPSFIGLEATHIFPLAHLDLVWGFQLFLNTNKF